MPQLLDAGTPIHAVVFIRRYKAVLTNAAGQELLTATGSDGPYMLMHIRDTTIALRKSSEQVGDEIVARLKPLKTT